VRETGGRAAIAVLILTGILVTTAIAVTLALDLP
jgi:hypothetical protein